FIDACPVRFQAFVQFGNTPINDHPSEGSDPGAIQGHKAKTRDNRQRISTMGHDAKYLRPHNADSLLTVGDLQPSGDAGGGSGKTMLFAFRVTLSTLDEGKLVSVLRHNFLLR